MDSGGKIGLFGLCTGVIKKEPDNIIVGFCNNTEVRTSSSDGLSRNVFRRD